MLKHSPEIQAWLETTYTSTKMTAKDLFPENFYSPFCSLHDQIFEWLDRKTFVDKNGVVRPSNKKVCAAPRGIGKTTIVRTVAAKAILWRDVNFITYTSNSADVAALEQKALEPGRLEKLFERYSGNGNGTGKRKKQDDTKALVISDDPTSPPALPPRPPVEIIETKPGIYREVPWKDTRSRSEIIADLQREVDDWRTNMIRQFTEKIDSHAEALKSLIEEQVK